MNFKKNPKNNNKKPLKKPKFYKYSGNVGARMLKKIQYLIKNKQQTNKNKSIPPFQIERMKVEGSN